VKQASRDTGSMCGCAHRGLVSRPALVEPPRMRVGLNPARGTVDPAPRRSASFADAKWPLSMEDTPIGQAVAGHAAAVDTVLAALAREDPREGVKSGPSKTGAGEATEVSEVGSMGRVGG
jgi:hypothetical protein